MSERREPRVLLIAEAANPEWVSVPLVGWSHSRAIARATPTHTVTQIRNRDAFLRAGLVEGEDFTAIDSESVAAPLYRVASLLRGGAGKGWTTVMAFSALSYYYFEHLVWRAFRDRIRAGEFDLVHRLTPLSPTIPSIIGPRLRRSGTPFVIGPLNGGLPWPAGFTAARHKEREWLSYLRGAYKLLPGYGRTRKHAAALIIASLATLDQVPARYRDKCVYVPENATEPERFGATRERVAQHPIRVVFVGRLVPYKGVDMLVEAAAPLIRDGSLTVDLIGDGPERPSIESMITELEITEGLRLHGWVEHTELQHHLAEADVLGFPSVREFGGGVVLEAMAAGLCPVVVDYGGPGELVTDSTGFRIPIGSRESIVSGFRDVLGRLAADPARVAAIGERAQQRVRSRFTWDAKAGQILEVYRWVLGRRADKPDFGFRD